MRYADADVVAPDATLHSAIATRRLLAPAHTSVSVSAPIASRYPQAGLSIAITQVFSSTHLHRGLTRLRTEDTIRERTVPKYDEMLAHEDKLSSNNTRPESSVIS